MSTKVTMTTASPPTPAQGTAHSLLDHLSTIQPKLQPTPRTNSKTNSRHFSWRKPNRIAKWDDFDCASLMESCGGIFRDMLKHTIEPVRFPHLDDVDTIKFSDEDSLEKHYVSPWVLPIVTTALSHAQRQHSADHGPLRPPFVKMVAGGTAKRTNGRKPDWAATRTMAADDPNQAANMLPGDTKVSHKWQSTQIVPKEVDSSDLTENWFWPLRQIFTYCINNNTRYGYIISDQEVVVFRVRAPQELTGPTRPGKWRQEEGGTIEYMPICHSTQATNPDDTPGGAEEPSAEKQPIHGEAINERRRRLTMNLAIWWLHLLAANDRSIQATYRPLKDEYLDGLGRAPTPLPSRYEGTPAASERTARRIHPMAPSPSKTCTSLGTATTNAMSEYILSPHIPASSSFSAIQSIPRTAQVTRTSARLKRKRDISPAGETDSNIGKELKAGGEIEPPPQLAKRGRAKE